MKIHINPIYILAIITLTSCKNYLDIKPKGSFVPVTVTDYDHLLDNSNTVELTFLDNNRGSLLSGLNDNLTMSEGQAKAGYILNNHPNIDRYYAYVFRQPYNDPMGADYFWSAGTFGIYPQVSYFNNTIEGIRSVSNKTTADEELAKASIAQALVARAWCYFNANLIYGPVYKPGTNNTTKTIPYVTSPDLGAPIPDLSTSEQVMAKVKSDLLEALPNLPDNSSWPSRANRSTGLAMLAYYHLFTKKFDSVAYYANLSWVAAAGNNASKVIYDYNLFSWSNPSNLVSSLITSPQDAFLNAVNNRETLFYRGTDTQLGQGTLLSYPSEENIALFDQSNDLRFKYFYISTQGYKTNQGGGYDDGIRYGNYRPTRMKSTDGFSFPELLLMRAEGYARTNQLNLAIDDLNTLRKYRYKTGTAGLTIGTQDQVINMVLQERRRELPLGGLKRFLDLKRLVLDNGKPWSKTKISHTLGSQIYDGTVDSPDFILKISNSVLQFNPGWGISKDTRPYQ